MARAKSMGDLKPANDHGRCPICREPGVASYRPFCSRRCADVDLARWLGGTYVIPGRGADDDEDGEARGEATTAGPVPGPRGGKGETDADA
jgi:hypothetical protein